MYRQGLESTGVVLMTHRVLWLGLLAGFLLLAFGCGRDDRKPDGKAPVVLRVHAWGAQPSGVTPSVLEKICDDFSQATGIAVRLEASPQQEYKEQIFLEVASHDSPDVFMTWPAGFLEGFVKAGDAHPLDDALAGDPAWRLRYHPGVFDDLTINGRVYAVPNTDTVAALFYNKRILDELRLSPPATLDELEAMIPPLAKAGHVPVAFGNREPWVGGLLAALLIERVGGMAPYRALEADSGDWSQPAFAEAGRILQRLAGAGAFPEGFADLSYRGAVEMFRDGRAAMVVTGSWAIPGILQSPIIQRDGLGVAPFPLVAGGRGAMHTWLGQTDLNLGISASSRHKAEAVRLLKWFSEPFEQRRLMEATGNLVVADVGGDVSIMPGVTRELLRLLDDRRETFLFYDVRFGRGVGVAFNDTIRSILAGVAPEQAFAELQTAIARGRVYRQGR